MKKIIAILAAVAFCTLPNGFAEEVPDDFTIDVNYIYPTSLPAYPSSDGYTLSVKDNVASADLPFVGESHTAVFSTDDIGYHFKDCPVKIKTRKKKNSTIYKFTAKSGYESVDVTVEIWPDGGADITCFTASKSIMRYSGELRTTSSDE